MYTLITASRLRTGEALEVGVVQAPDDDYAPLVRPILAHKSRNEQWHLDQVFAGRVDPLETRFYLGCLNEQPVCNIMVSEHGGVGIMSHVYTRPEHRRKGIARLVMAGQMADFNDRDGRYLTLSTGYDTHPYYLYYSFGFRSVIPDSGHMKYAGNAAFEAEHFRGEGVRVVPGDWKNWPSLNVLCAQDGPPYVRNVGLGHIGPRMFEGAYLGLMKLTQEDADHQVRLLVTDREAVTGYATLMPDTRWRGETCLLDLFVHPAFTAYWGALLDSFSMPAGRKIQSHVEPGDSRKTAALKDAGFVRESTLRKQFKAAGQAMDVEVYARHA
ncbi:MAG: GNAT family N-acetyltransferase [Gemmatimonadetes bacterium]|nr:GNAT family N-acetyltransferase [Gemmatimonadota bacterium]